MKICLTSQGDNLDALLDPRFGRCAYFIFFDIESGSFEAIANPNVTITGGAGIQSAQLMASKNVDAVITNKIGPNALRTLNAADIKVITDVSGLIKEIIEQYRDGKLIIP